MITQDYLTLVPAYGRDYKSKKEVEADFRGGKDFEAVGIGGGGYCTVKDIAPGTKIQLRYKRQTSVTIVTV